MVIGIFAATQAVVYIGECVAALIPVSRQVAELFVLRLLLRSGVKFVHFPPSVPMAPQPVKVQEPIRFGEDFELSYAPSVTVFLSES